MKRISLLGATGSIGRQTLGVTSLELVAIAVGNNIELCMKIIQAFRPKLVAVKIRKIMNNAKASFQILSLHMVNMV